MSRSVPEAREPVVGVWPETEGVPEGPAATSIAGAPQRRDRDASLWPGPDEEDEGDLALRDLGGSQRGAQLLEGLTHLRSHAWQRTR